MSVSNLDSRKAEAAIERWVGDKRGEAVDWLQHMGYGISGTVGWLNTRKSGGHINAYPSVRRDGDSVRLAIRWRSAGRRVRRLSAKSLLVAKRHVWRRWTAQLGK